MASPGFLSTDPAIATRELWERLPGKYRQYRETYHDELIDGETFTSKDIICHSYDKSEYVRRTSADPAYESELLQTSTLERKSTSGKKATKTEQRVFRFENGELSIWNADGNGAVTGKMTGVTLAREIKEPEPNTLSTRYQEAHFKAGWEDEKGTNDLRLVFRISGPVLWLMHHRLEWRIGGALWQMDFYEPVGGGDGVNLLGDRG